MVDIVDSDFGHQSPGSQAQQCGKQVLVLPQETTNYRPDQDGSETEHDSPANAENGAISRSLLRNWHRQLVPVGGPSLRGQVPQVRTPVEVQRGADECVDQQDVRNVLLGHQPAGGIDWL